MLETKTDQVNESVEASQKASTLEDTSSQAGSGTSPRTLKSRITALLTHHNAPYAFGAVVLAVAALFVVQKKTNLDLPLIGGPSFVLFDPVKFTNAQRAAASLLVAAPNADLSLTMTQVAKHAEAVIKEEANGALVLVKQAVVAPEGIPEITDKVLLRFGLPTDVPTITVTSDKDSLTPTDLAYSPAQLREDYRIELSGRAAKLAEEESKKSRQDSVLP